MFCNLFSIKKMEFTNLISPEITEKITKKTSDDFAAVKFVFLL